MKRDKLAAQLFTVREFTKDIESVRETFAKVEKIGYPAVQISAFGPVDPKEVAKVINDSPLTVAATHMGWPRFLNELDAVIDEHHMWGCKHSAIGMLPMEYVCAEGVDRFLTELAPIAEKLAAEGIDFSYHNHNHELIRYGDDTWLGALYSKADPKHLKAEIDTYWIQAGGGDPADWIRRCSGRIPLLHLKDMTVSEGREQHFAEIGEGNLNWPAIFAAAEEAGSEWLIVEQDQCYGRDPFDCLALSYKNLTERL
jgi:sugar phosphate isomerase/epimerase